MNEQDKPEPIFEPDYWKSRLERAEELEQLSRSIYEGIPDRFLEVTSNHASDIRANIRPEDSVLDIGCGYGRFFEIFPEHTGNYLGVDISPDLLRVAQAAHPNKQFIVGDMRKDDYGMWDWVLAIWVKNMVLCFAGPKEWEEIEKRLVAMCRIGVLLISLPQSEDCPTEIIRPER